MAILDKIFNFFFSVFIVPAFELKAGLNIPDSKSALLDLWKKNQLRPFYEKVCFRCQVLTDYDRWKRSVLLLSL